MQFNIFISETLLILLICQNLFLVTKGLHISYTVGFNTKCVDEKLASLQIIQLTLDQCVVECDRRKNCRGISYRERFTMCNLIDVDNPTYLSSTPADCVLVSKTDMKYELPQTCKDCEKCDLDTKQCIITECPRLLTVKDGTVFGNMNNIGNRIKYTCNPGFKRETEGAIATCQADGTWSLTPRCPVDLCYNNPCKNGGTCTTNTIDQYTCTCTHGFIGPNCDIGNYVCEGNTMNLWCPAGKLIDIKSANYGRTQDGRVCLHSAIFTTNCMLPSSFQTVSSRCSGKPSCQVTADLNTFGTDPCLGTYKYLEVDYICS